MTTGEIIHDRRVELGMTVDQVALLCGKNRATLYRYESGSIEDIPARVIPSIAAALKTSPAALMGWEDHPDNVSSESDRMLNIFLQLDPDNRQSVLDFAEYKLMGQNASRKESV